MDNASSASGISGMGSGSSRGDINKEKSSAQSHKQSQRVADPLEPAKAHGNEPSRGAKVDAQIQQEEEEHLKRTGKRDGHFGPNV